MKNKTVEQMYRNEFNLSDDIQVNVEFLMSGSNWAEFSVTWYDNDNHKAYESITKLPLQLPVETV